MPEYRYFLSKALRTICMHSLRCVLLFYSFSSNSQRKISWQKYLYTICRYSVIKANSKMWATVAISWWTSHFSDILQIKLHVHNPPLCSSMTYCLQMVHVLSSSLHHTRKLSWFPTKLNVNKWLSGDFSWGRVVSMTVSLTIPRLKKECTSLLIVQSETMMIYMQNTYKFKCSTTKKSSHFFIVNYVALSNDFCSKYRYN